jgi:hypothetical protein
VSLIPPWSAFLAIRRYFFAVTNYFLYGESIIYYFKHVVFVDAYFAVFARNHRFISFMLYVIGKLPCLAPSSLYFLCWMCITQGFAASSRTSKSRTFLSSSLCSAGFT